MRNGEEVKISKRAGSYVTVRDLIEWSGGATPGSEAAVDLIDEETIRRGRDAVRFFLISRKADTEFVFDIDLALKQNDENPVHYVQYAHARICSVIAECNARYGLDENALASVELAPLTSERSMALLNKLAEFPDMRRQHERVFRHRFVAAERLQIQFERRTLGLDIEHRHVGRNARQHHIAGNQRAGFRAVQRTVFRRVAEARHHAPRPAANPHVLGFAQTTVLPRNRRHEARVVAIAIAQFLERFGVGQTVPREVPRRRLATRVRPIAGCHHARLHAKEG